MSSNMLSTTVFRRPVESGQYLSIRYSERLAEAGIESTADLFNDETILPSPHLPDRVFAEKLDPAAAVIRELMLPAGWPCYHRTETTYDRPSMQVMRPEMLSNKDDRHEESPARATARNGRKARWSASYSGPALSAALRPP